MARLYRSRNWALEVRQDRIDVTSDRPTPNERWRFTDAQGHEHRYDRGYPTLDFVVDEQHWCDGTEGICNHDPHWAVDESHYECKICHQAVEPTMDPPYTPKSVPGMIDATLEGLRSDGWRIATWLDEGDYRRILEALDEDRDAIVRQILDDTPDERIMRSSFQSTP